MFELADKVAFVTGASRGIGRAICQALAAQGAFVEAVFHQNEAAAKEVLASIEAAGGKGQIRQLDVRDQDACQGAIREVAKGQGRLDILVNCAGVNVDGLVFQIRRESWDLQMDTNLLGTVNCSRAAMRAMVRKKKGRIINISSVFGEMGAPGASAYAASKAGVLAFTKSLAKEMGPKGITANVVSPGIVPTDMTAGMSETVRETILSRTPLGRLGEPEEIAAAVAFLASDEASYITGHVLRVNGGLYV